MTKPYVIRPADWSIPGERNMVRKSWIRSHSTSGLARLAGHDAYYSGQHDLVDRLLDRCTVRVACSATSRETILGWACLELPGTLHYVYVVEDFRRAGVARDLLGGLGERVQYTHRTDMVREFKLPDGWWFNLFALMVK